VGFVGEVEGVDEEAFRGGRVVSGISSEGEDAQEERLGCTWNFEV
jgi:hypothetical protein